ncbi:MAG: hypothetical protein ABSF71_11485 [Terriglobia bacterium]|jgi:hypothetical protein
MPSESKGLTREPFSLLMRGAMATLAVLVVARLVLELVGVPQDIARYLSSTVGMLLVAIYVAAVGPLRGGLRKFSRLLLPALILAAWTEGWVILVTIIAAVLRLSRTHFAESEDYGNWGHLGRHLMGHIIEIGVFFVIILLLMTVVHTLWRWPVTVAPGAMLGVFVIMRFWTEAMGLQPFRSAAWSTTILVFLGAFYVGGVGARMGLTEARQLLVPSLVLGWVWRGWVFLATLLAAGVPFFKTHFFDPSSGDIPMRLLRTLAGTVVEGLIAGLLLWGIAVWIACATQPGDTRSQSKA